MADAGRFRRHGAGAVLHAWFLVQTKPAAEKSALEHLERQGYRVYHPRLLQRALRRGRWLDRIVSLFPRYVFVQVDVGPPVAAPIRSTVGVANVVRFGAKPPSCRMASSMR